MDSVARPRRSPPNKPNTRNRIRGTNWTDIAAVVKQPGHMRGRRAGGDSGVGGEVRRGGEIKQKKPQSWQRSRIVGRGLSQYGSG
eukprot:716600-Rhodomonas_salina.1